MHRQERLATEAQSGPANGGRPLSEVFKDLRDETACLFRQEVALARVETSEKLARLARNGLTLALGGAVALSALLFLMLAASCGLYAGLISLGLSHMTAGWLSPLAVAILGGLAGYIMIRGGISRLKQDSLLPEKTIQSLQESKEWIQTKITS